MTCRQRHPLPHFNPLPPHGGRPISARSSIEPCRISIHSLRMEGDLVILLKISLISYFNPLPPHGGRLISVYTGFPGSGISIHSLRMEGDSPYRRRKTDSQEISIHSLRMEGDQTDQLQFRCSKPFQSTPSAWRETHELTDIPPAKIFQSTPSAWRETF